MLDFSCLLCLLDFGPRILAPVRAICVCVGLNWGDAPTYQYHSNAPPSLSQPEAAGKTQYP